MSENIHERYDAEVDELLPEDEIERRDTVLRILLSVLFVLIASVIETVLGVFVIFELAVALVTKRPPSVRVRELANRIISYYYRIGRYLTYNESRVPFPFSDFPDALEGDAWRPDESESKALGLNVRDFDPDQED